MAEQPGEPRTSAETDDIDPGEPVAQLAGLGQTPTRGFFSGIRRRIERRYLVADASEFSWSGVSFIMLEFMKVFFQLFQTARDAEGDRDGRND
ncbi:MAG: hypothetical protein OEU92_35355 [Alphaproteobacteria bacterium]|nr:hypothetical protein [Alphaproteobacteria bacterium]